MRKNCHSSFASRFNESFLPLMAASFFVLTYAIKAFTDGPYIRGEISSGVAYTKYLTALIACLFAVAHNLGHPWPRFNKEFTKLTLVSLLFLAISLVQQIDTNTRSSDVYIELIKLAMPVLLAFCMLNVLDSRLNYRCMLAILIVSFAGYLVNLRAEGGSILSIFQADFTSSQSETESSGFAEISLMLTFYFAYVRRSKIALFFAATFTVLTFKRLALLMALLALVIGSLYPKLMYARVPRAMRTTGKVATLLLTLVWFWLLLPNQESLFVSLFGQTPFDFTMGRSVSLRYLYSTGFDSYGFGSASETIQTVFGVPFEMDLIKIAFELTPFALIIFVWVFWDLAGDSFWGVVIISYYMVNMITSDSLASNFSFTLAYIVIGLVNESDHQGAPARFSRHVSNHFGKHTHDTLDRNAS